MSVVRQCSRTACGRPSVATLTYVYVQQTAVVGPLATYAEPHSYDLCAVHAGRLTAPKGWEMLRLPDVDVHAGPEALTEHPEADDLYALAAAVREQRDAPAPRGAPEEPTSPTRPGAAEGGMTEVARRRHLRVLRDG